MTEFEQKQIEQLNRIADVLEDINGTLIGMSSDISALGDCVCYVPAYNRGYIKTPEYHFLRIGGDVSSGE